MKIINEYISFSEQNNSGIGDMYIYGDIADQKWYDDDVTPVTIRDSLNEMNGFKEVNIHINSYGGSTVAGNAIVAILDNFKRKNPGTQVNAYIEGIAASMGSGIPMACDKVYMNDNGLFMIHKPLTMTMGNADDLAKTIEVLDKTEDTLVRNYMRKFNGSEEQLRQMMADETWMTADEAKGYGFVDEIVQSAQIAASAKGIKISNQEFNQKIADFVKDKYPTIQIEKEEKKLNYNEQLKNFGIDEEQFKGYIENDDVISIVNAAIQSQKQEPVEQFIDKAKAIEFLGCEDITSEQILDYAKKGMNPPDISGIQDKADEYDKIVEDARKEALVNALKAQGETYNESRMKKFLSVLDYKEIMEQNKAWEEQAKKALNAGKRVSSPEQVVSNNVAKENMDDYKF